MGLLVDATLGEKIRFYRQQAGLAQKELAGLCEVSESAIRNYELGNRVPDFLTLKNIAEQLRVSYYAIADVDLTELDGVVQALFRLEEIYGLYPTEVDGHIHFVFKDSVALEDFQKNPDIALAGIGSMFQQRVRSFIRACTLHNTGELSDEDYALWKSKFPAFMEDLQNGVCGEGEDGEIDPAPALEPKSPARSRKRKVNSGR